MIIPLSGSLDIDSIYKEQTVNKKKYIQGTRGF